jgi:hypothetical protein
MRKHSNSFTPVVIGCVFLLAWAFRSIYEDALKAWVFKKLTDAFGPRAAELMSGFVELTPAVGLAIGVIWFVYWYVRRELEARNLEFVRNLEPPVGDFGHYRASLKVRNTSPTAKMSNCRCEIIELMNSEGEVIYEHIGLRTKNQESKETQGRFNLDQDSDKEIPIFDIDQSADPGVTVINADGWDIALEHGVYIAKVRGYGDSGKPDEITVRIDSRNCEFEIIPSRAARTYAPMRQIKISS